MTRPPGTEAAAARDAVRRIGRYEVLHELGRGGMAVVYQARQLDLDRFVALKELSAFHASDEEIVHRFLREARLAGSLTHSNIVTVYDAFEWDGLPYLSMEYVPCGSLRPLIGRLSFAQIAGVLEGILAGLSHAHGSGIVHRDLKPENLLVTSDGQLKIADFGIAKAINRLTQTGFATRTGTTVGTPTYMAPEQALGGTIGIATDLYATGVVAYELLAGRPPFAGDEPVAVMMRHVSDPPPALTELASDVPPDVVPWVMRLLEKRPEARFASAEAAWSSLEDVVLRALGPRWRRDARLPVRAGKSTAERAPLTPASFAHVREDGEPSADDEYDSFTWGTAPSPPTPPEIDAEPPASPSAPPAAEPPASPSAPPAAEPPAPPPAPPRAEPPAPPPEPAELGATMAPRQLPEPQPVASARGHRRALVAAVALAVIATGVLSVLLAGGGSPTKSTPPAATAPQRARNRTIALTYRAPWRITRVAPPAALGLRDPIALERAGGAGERLYAGTTSARGAALVGRELIDVLPGGLPSPERVHLGTLDALRYRDLGGVVKSALVTLFVLPTTRGVVTLACATPRPWTPTGGPCGEVASTARLLAGRALPTAASRRYAGAVDARLQRLAEARARRLPELRRPDSRAAQARAASAIAAATDAARRSLAGLAVSPRERALQQALLDALAAARDGYRKMARGARAGLPAAYAAGRRLALRGDRAVAGAVRNFRALGYEGALALHPVPAASSLAGLHAPPASPSSAPPTAAAPPPSSTQTAPQTGAVPPSGGSTGGGSTGGGSTGGGSTGGGSSGGGDVAPGGGGEG